MIGTLPIFFLPVFRSVFLKTPWHACQLGEQLKKEVAELMDLAEQADSAALPDGLSIPEEIRRREDRLSVIAKAKAEIERRADERYQQEQTEYNEKMARREQRKNSGKAPKPPEPGARDKDQVNLTDDESRIMPTSGGAFEQAYCTIEPTFGIQKEVIGYRRFLVRGLEAVSKEWDMVCLAFNLRRMFSLSQAN